MIDSYRLRRTERSGQLLQRFNDCSLSRLAFQDEKDFTVHVKTNRLNYNVYGKSRKCDIEPMKEKRFPWNWWYAITRKGVIGEPFSLEKRSKTKWEFLSWVFTERNDIYLSLKRCFLLMISSLFKTVHFPSWKESSKPFERTLISRLVKNIDWPRNCSDFHPLDYFFWAKVQQNVHECRLCKYFPSIKELTNLSKPGMTALRTYIPSEKPWNNWYHFYVPSLKEKVETV